MTTGMKIYAAALLLLIAAILINWVWVPGDVRAINQQLAADAYLADYPYPFRVLRIEGSSAVMSSPRSSVLSVAQMIGAIDPELAGISVTNEKFLSAQQALADHQAYAAKKVISSAEINQVIWELDRSWLQSNGIHWVE